jgi:NADH dehydrogenase FAD-containing subunit
VELAGELAEAVEQSGSKASITLVSGTDRVLPMLKSSASSAARKMLEQKKVKIVTSKRVMGVETPADDGSNWTVSLEGGDKLSADLYIPTTGVVPNNSFIPAEFLDKDGWVMANHSPSLRLATSPTTLCVSVSRPWSKHMSQPPT